MEPITFSVILSQNKVVLLEEAWTSSFAVTCRTFYINKMYGFYQDNKLILVTTIDSFSHACISCTCTGSNSIPFSYFLHTKVRTQGHESFPVGAIKMK